MTDRKYVILNTSIQTGSNAGQLIEDEHGNVAAQIELRLPDSLFQPNEGGQKVDTVSMMTTKFRISLVDTPIASIPLNTNKTKGNTLFSTCALDVYPFTITDDGTIEPYNVFKDSTRAFPFYKSHRIYFNFYANEAQNRNSIYEAEGVANSGYIFPTNSPFYPVLKETGILDDVGYHCMNLVLNNMHGNVKIENDQMLVTDIGMLEQLISNSFANALYYASTETETYVDIDLALYEGSETLVPPPLSKTPVTFNNTQWVVWKYSSTTDILDFDNHAGFHPKVTLSENSFTISYDTAAFGNNIPLIWNTSYIPNFDMPYQTRVDDKLALFYQPPPKRVFKYGLTNNGDDGYTFTLPDDLENTVFNIICNEAMKNTFPFLPWMEVHLPTPIPISQNLYTQTEQRISTDMFRLKATLNFDQPTTFKMGKFIGYKHGDTLPISVEIPDDDKYYMIYQYEIPLMGRDTPTNRLNQKMYFGAFSEMTGSETVVSTGSEGYMTDYITILPPRIEVISETTTANPQYPVGVTTLDTQYNDQPETVETTITTTIGDTFLFYSQIEGGAFIGPSYSGFGDWDTSSSLGNYEASSFPPLPVAHQTSIGGGVTRTITKLYDLTGILVGIPEDNIAQDTPMVITETNYPRTQIDLQIDVEPVDNPQIPDDVVITPNLYDEGKFYILDCSSVDLTIGQQEPIPESQTTKFQIDTTTSTRKDRIVTDYRIYSSLESGSSLNARTVKYNNTVGFAPYQIAPHDPNNWWQLADGTKVTESAPFILHFRKWKATDDGGETIFNFWLMQKIGGDNSITPYRYENITFPNNVISSTETVLPPETETETSTTYSYDPSLTPGTVTKPYELIGTTKTSTEITGTPEVVDVNQILKETGRIQLRKSDHQSEYYRFVDNDRYLFTPENDIPYINSFFKDRWRPAEWVPLSVQPDIGGYYAEYGFAYHYLVNDIYRDPEDSKLVTLDVIAVFMDDVTLDYPYDASIDLLVTTDPDSTIKNAVNMETQTYEQKEIVTSIVPNPENSGVGNLRLNFTWSNLPTVIISPIQSYVMVLNGMQVTQEIHPINIAQAAGSSLVSTIPIIENYYSLAQTLRDLHDELVVIKDSFEDAVTYKLNPSGGMERTITFSVKYITKDGRLHQLYIPKNGVFTLQLTFGLSYYMA